MSFSDFIENKVLDSLFGDTPYVPPASFYVALSKTLPSDAGVITEPSGGNYSRVQMLNNATVWPAAVDGVKTSTIPATFPVASNSWGTVTHYAVFDSFLGGNMIGWGQLIASRLIEIGDSFEIPSVSITLN